MEEADEVGDGLSDPLFHIEEVHEEDDADPVGEKHQENVAHRKEAEGEEDLLC